MRKRGLKMKHERKKQEKEIYLNHANRTDKANLKTILRYKVTDTEKPQHSIIKSKGK